MSGIVGIWHLDEKPVDAEVLRRMRDSLAHRGPDAAGAWSGGAVGLAHRMLWTTPESLQERLPFAFGRDLVITADARIDNRAELMAGLDLDRATAGDIGDAELIVRAYERWGESCPSKLLGDFSFAIWDGRRRVLFCARDHFGVKPFYYHHSNRMCVFGSEIKALLSLPDVPRHLNEVRVAEYFVPMFDDTAITFYEDIVRLPPAHSAVVSKEGVRLQRYWALDPAREIRFKSDDQYADAFREIFTEAVRCRLRSAYPTGSMLSGGLDSSSVVGVARKLLARQGSRQLHTFSAVFDKAPESDESPYYNAVIAQGDVCPHFVPMADTNPRADIGRFLDVQDEPFSVPYVFMYSALYRAASDTGVRVLIDGMDGDSAVSHGLGYLTELAATCRWVKLCHEVRALSRRVGRPARAIFWEHVARPLTPDYLRRMWRITRGRNGPPWGIDSIVNPEFARRIDLVGRYESLRHDRLTPARTSKEYHRQRVTWGVHAFLLEILDRAAASCSVEGRHVCYDIRIAEFCLALPGDQKLRDGWTRAVMRRALSDLLPPAVQSRGGKSDISAVWIRSLLDCDRTSVEDVLGSPTIATFVDRAALRQAYERYIDLGRPRDAINVWWAFVLTSWLRKCDVAAIREDAA